MAGDAGGCTARAPDGAYTRQQIMELTGVQEGVLGFWIKEGVLTAVEGGEGRGSHRRFSAMQVSSIGLIKELQSYGLNVQQLKSFGRLLQEGIGAVEGCGLHSMSLLEAVYLAKDLARFRVGECVDVWSDREKEKIPAVSECQIVDQHLVGAHYDLREMIIEYASGVTNFDQRALKLAQILYSEMYGDSSADYSIMLWRGNNGEWEFADSPEPGEQFTPIPKGRRSGIILGIGVIVREIWGIDLDERAHRGRIRSLAHSFARGSETADRMFKLGLYSDADIAAAHKLASKMAT